MITLDTLARWLTAPAALMQTRSGMEIIRKTYKNHFIKSFNANLE